MADGRNSYWLLIGGVPSGPFTATEVHTRLAAGKVTRETLACPVGGGVWRPLLETPGIGLNVGGAVAGRPAMERPESPPGPSRQPPSDHRPQKSTAGLAARAAGVGAALGLVVWGVSGMVVAVFNAASGGWSAVFRFADAQGPLLVSAGVGAVVSMGFVANQLQHERRLARIAAAPPRRPTADLSRATWICFVITVALLVTSYLLRDPISWSLLPLILGILAGMCWLYCLVKLAVYGVADSLKR